MTQPTESGPDATSLARADQLLSSISDDRRNIAQPGCRERIIEKARELISTLETPLEALLWMIWAEPGRAMASRVALDLKLFETLVADDGCPKSATQLAAVTGASPALVNRIARKLASMYMIKEVAPAEYAPNDLTHTLSIPKYSGGIRFCYDVVGPSLQHMPAYLKETDHKNPDNPDDGPFQFATKSASPFAFLNERPQLLEAFHGYVDAQTEGRPAWWEEGFYPVRERLVEGLKLEDDSSAFLDVGGGTGQLLEGFRNAVPDYKGRLVLQEQPSVIEYAKAIGVNERIELQPHDFFTEEPIKGARVYHMRFILHDWSDDFCLKILAHLKDAMVPGYSKILINEFVMADKGANWQSISMDFLMLSLCSSFERTETEWRNLIARAGLNIAGIWTKGIGNESLIEVIL